MIRFWIGFAIVFSFVFTVTAQDIKNPDAPKKGQFDLKISKLWEIDGPEDKPFGAIQSIDVGPNGNLYVLDHKLKKVFIFSPEGKLIREFGKSGEGPGEFKNFRMGKQVYFSGDNFIFVDRGRISYFSLEGDFRKSVKIPGNISPKGFISVNEVISAPEIMRDKKKEFEEIKSYHLITKKEKILAKFRPFKKASAEKSSSGSRMVVAIIIGGITPMMSLDYRNGILFYGMTDRYSLTRKDLKKDAVSIFSVEGREPKPVRKSFLEQMQKRMKGAPPDMVKKILDGLPKKASFFHRISIQDNGNVFLHVSDPGNDSGQRVDEFSNKGEFIRSFTVKIGEEERIDRICFSKNTLYMSLEDEEGELKLVKFEISLPN